MSSSYKSVFLSLALFTLALAGCSGGGGGPSSGAGAAPAAAKMVTGVAATGAPIVGTVYLLDASSSPVTLKTTTASDGSFSFNATGLTPPFLIKASSGDKNIYSLATDFGITNVTPLTSMVLAQAAGGANLDTLYNNPVHSTITAAAAKLPDAVTEVKLVLAPLMKQYGVGSMDIVNAQFTANHTGIDALLDAINVSIADGTVTITSRQAASIVFTAPSGNLRAGGTMPASVPVTPPASSTPGSAVTTPSVPEPVPAEVPSGSTSTPSTAPVSGSALYTAKCAGCHGDIASTDLSGRADLGTINGAIASNRGRMGFLSVLSSSELQSISDAISAAASSVPSATPPSSSPVPSTSTPSVTIDGSALYKAKCAGCHGSMPNSRKIGATVVRTQNAISGDVGGMGYLSSLTNEEIQAIVLTLNPEGSAASPVPPAPSIPVPSTPAPVQPPSTSPQPATPVAPAADGTALYNGNCANCHGALASSNKKNITLTRLQNAITNNIAGMGYLATLATDLLQAIVDVLSPATPAPAPSPTPTPAPTPSPAPAPVADGATLYTDNCAGCHGPLASSNKQGMTLTRLQNAISNNIAGMGYLSSLSAAEQQSIAAALSAAAPAPTPVPAPTPTPAPVPAPTPVPSLPPDGAALYAANCAGCHGALGSSTKQGITISRLQNAVNNNVGNMGYLSTLTVSEVQAIVTVLTPATPTPTPSPAPVTDGAALYSTSCASCHGPLATSSKLGITAVRLQNAITNNVGNMGYLSTLTAANQQAIVTALTPATPAPTPTPNPTPNPTPTPAPDGAALYGSNCAGCHGVLASSGKAGTTASRIQTAITGNVGNMGYLSTLTSPQITAIATALAGVTPPPTPAPAPVCGSCHVIPPATGRHSKHKSKNIACATCHGTGYTTTAVNAATHNNGVKNLTSTIGWNATSRSCANSCHGRETW